MDRIEGIRERIPLGVTRERSARPRTESTAAPLFREQLAEVQVGALRERIDQQLARIDEIGQHLLASRSLADLKRYREAIADLFRDVSRSMNELRLHSDFDADTWEQRTLMTIARVEAELERLAPMILNQEHDRVAILEQIGLIKGLLLDVRL